jgi:hypothetical protein
MHSSPASPESASAPNPAAPTSSGVCLHAGPLGVCLNV